MKVRPLLFRIDMVRAVLRGDKSQTRRLVRPPRRLKGWTVEAVVPEGEAWRLTCREPQRIGCPPELLATEVVVVRCPYGVPGDGLWVRETWAAPPGSERIAEVAYRADFPTDTLEDVERVVAAGPWHPNLHMPRWASRLTLALTGVRAERLKDITEADAIAEGARRFDQLPARRSDGKDARWSMQAPSSTDQCYGSARHAFGAYFQHLHGGDAWIANPFVWVLSFTVTTTTTKEADHGDRQ